MSRHAPRQLTGPLNERLRTARLLAGLSQEKLAPRVGVTLRTIQRWEDGASEPKASQVTALAMALGVATSDFYPRDPEPTEMAA